MPSVAVYLFLWRMLCSVIMLNVVLLSVMAPFTRTEKTFLYLFSFTGVVSNVVSLYALMCKVVSWLNFFFGDLSNQTFFPRQLMICSKLVRL
jgi:hypothetical protein